MSGQNYLKSLLALGFQAFLIMVVVGHLLRCLIQQHWYRDGRRVRRNLGLAMGYTVLLCFCLFKTEQYGERPCSAPIDRQINY